MQHLSASCAVKLQLKKCRTCGAVGVGPAAVRLFPLDGLLYCAPDFKSALDWTTNREAVTMGLRMEEAHRLIKKHQDVPAYYPKDWKAYLCELSGLAAEALVMGDRRTFVHYFARALWAWELSQQEE